jgi:hypothetical protein
LAYDCVSKIAARADLLYNAPSTIHWHTDAKVCSAILQCLALSADILALILGIICGLGLPASLLNIRIVKNASRPPDLCLNHGRAFGLYLLMRDGLRLACAQRFGLLFPV